MNLKPPLQISPLRHVAKQGQMEAQLPPPWWFLIIRLIPHYSILPVLQQQLLWPAASTRAQGYTFTISAFCINKLNTNPIFLSNTKHHKHFLSLKMNYFLPFYLLFLLKPSVKCKGLCWHLWWKDPYVLEGPVVLGRGNPVLFSGFQQAGSHFKMCWKSWLNPWEMTLCLLSVHWEQPRSTPFPQSQWSQNTCHSHNLSSHVYISELFACLFSSC